MTFESKFEFLVNCGWQVHFSEPEQCGMRFVYKCNMTSDHLNVKGEGTTLFEALDRAFDRAIENNQTAERFVFHS